MQIMVRYSGNRKVFAWHFRLEAECVFMLIFTFIILEKNIRTFFFYERGVMLWFVCTYNNMYYITL